MAPSHPHPCTLPGRAKPPEGWGIRLDFSFFFFNLCNQTTNVRKERTDLSQAFYVLGFLKFFLSFLFFFGNYCLCLDLLQNEKLCYFNMKKPSHGI